ncbi:hypothetical protein FRC03_004188 [Tulasnella sp. 419]|nr:hypothetical protein FRC03_004188 [Tulasnella sp. 419]
MSETKRGGMADLRLIWKSFATIAKRTIQPESESRPASSPPTLPLPLTHHLIPLSSSLSAFAEGEKRSTVAVSTVSWYPL